MNIDLKFKSMLVLITLAFGSTMCKGPENTTRPVGSVAMVQPLILYKTTADYQHNTPVALNQDGTAIVGFPAPRDLLAGKELRTPVVLVGGYLLDRRGIGPSTGFISLTYREYANLGSAPSTEELWNQLIDKRPIKEMWRCDRQSSDSLNVQYANNLINNDLLRKKCLKLK